jgi:hypothetical protein
MRSRIRRLSCRTPAAIARSIGMAAVEEPTLNAARAAPQGLATRARAPLSLVKVTCVTALPSQSAETRNAPAARACEAGCRGWWYWEDANHPGSALQKTLVDDGGERRFRSTPMRIVVVVGFVAMAAACLAEGGRWQRRAASSITSRLTSRGRAYRGGLGRRLPDESLPPSRRTKRLCGGGSSSSGGEPRPTAPRGRQARG